MIQWNYHFYKHDPDGKYRKVSDKKRGGGREKKNAYKCNAFELMIKLIKTFVIKLTVTGVHG